MIYYSIKLILNIVPYVIIFDWYKVITIDFIYMYDISGLYRVIQAALKSRNMQKS